MKILVKILAPLFLIALAAALVFYLLRTREAPEVSTPERAIPPVVVAEVRLATERPLVEANGVLRPRHALDLRAEIAGTILRITPEMEAGTLVEAGTLLIELAPEDMRSALAARTAELAEARLLLAEEIARGAQAEREWQRLGRGEEPTPLTLRVPQRERAEARVTSAEATLGAAERDLQRTQLRAPFTGIVAERGVAPGEVLATPGALIGRIVAVGNPEVRAAVPTKLLHLISIPGAQATLRGESGLSLSGRVRGVAPELEGSTRMAELIIEVNDEDELLIPFGSFLRITLEGKALENAARLPRVVLRSEDTVWVVTDEERVESRSVRIVHRTADEVMIDAGLASGERVVRSPLPFFSDGMRVRIVEEADPDRGERP